MQVTLFSASERTSRHGRGLVARIAQAGLALLLLCGLAACADVQELASNLSAKQSIEMSVALSRSGVSPLREQSSSGRELEYRILVPRSEYTRALEVLHEYGLPRSVDESLEELTRPRGFVPNSPQLSQLRFDHALELKVERALLALPGVIEAKVILHSSEAQSASQFGSAQVQRGVSVVIRFVPSADSTSISAAEVKELVSQAIAGVSSENVQVRIVRASIPTESANFVGAELVQMKPFSFRVPSAELVTAGVQILVMFAAFCFAGVGLGLLWAAQSRKRRSRKIRASLSGAEGGRSMFIEASLQDNSQTKASLPPVRGSFE